MAISECAVGIMLALLTAHTALAYHRICVSETLKHAIIEYKQRAEEVLAWVCLHVCPDAAVQLIHVFESLLLEIP